ncbi:hypothetical protein SPB21_22250 [Leptothoe sp. ISB3NOV94-8A]
MLDGFDLDMGILSLTASTEKRISVDTAGHFVGGAFDWLDWRSALVALTLI